MSEGEEALAIQVEAFGMPPPVRQHRFCEANRRWAFDFAWPSEFVALEVDGGIWGRSSHGYGLRYEKQCERGMRAALEGWIVIHVTPGMVKSGVALSMLAYTLEEARSRPIARLAGQAREARQVARDARGLLVEFEADERVSYWFAINDTLHPWIAEEGCDDVQ